VKGIYLNSGLLSNDHKMIIAAIKAVITHVNLPLSIDIATPIIIIIKGFAVNKTKLFAFS